MGERTKWTGGDACDCCGKTANTMYDAETKKGPWAFMCPECWKKHGLGRIGLGYGQRYDRDPFDHGLYKTAG